MGRDNEHAKIKEAFAAYFKDFDISLPDAVPASGLVKQAGWNIRYIAGRDAGRSYLELYAMHRLTNDRHLRIYDDGTVDILPTVSQGAMFSPDIPGDRERSGSGMRDPRLRGTREPRV